VVCAGLDSDDEGDDVSDSDSDGEAGAPIAFNNHEFDDFLDNDDPLAEEDLS
jgi:hypothetical protein